MFSILLRVCIVPPVVPHVAVAVDRSLSYGRGVLRGIADYVETFGPWSIYLEPRSAGRYAPGWLRRWRGDGILAYIEDPALARRFGRSGIPTVELFGHRFDLRLPQVGNDDDAIGRLAAEHLLDRHLRRFAFSGYPGEAWVERRFRGFREALARSGFGCERLDAARAAGTPSRWEREQERLARRLRTLPKPVGLFACSDRHAQRVLDACRRARLRVPDAVAVLGVDNDEETCRLADPPLSSVMDDPRRVGFEAARLLDRRMSGRRAPLRPLLVPPLGVVARRSTDVAAVDDPLAAVAVRAIRARAGRGLRVEDLIAEARVSRAVFYRRFRAATGRTPHEEIVRARVERVKALLRQTALPLEEIAAETGFDHPEYLSVVFRRETGMTPGSFRRG